MSAVRQISSKINVNALSRIHQSPVQQSAAGAAAASAVYSEPKVSFFQSVAVVLIPTCAEYKAAHLYDSLWYQDDDYHDFKISCRDEIRQCLMGHPGMTVKDAKKVLYSTVYDEVHSCSSPGQANRSEDSCGMNDDGDSIEESDNDSIQQSLSPQQHSVFNSWSCSSSMSSHREISRDIITV